MRDFPKSGTVELETSQDTQAFGAKLGAALEAGDVIILDGPLGAGKTTLTQGIALGLGVKGRVTSPTFVIAREHKSTVSGPNLVHVDAYRLLGDDATGELDSLDLDTDLDDAVVVAEWGGGVAEALSEQYLLVTLDRESATLDDPESHTRIISWKWVVDHS
ncbi:MAG: tRNA (adenosine(37)-N6)-threonylcarbamoyltransferase complex ATPase subunit type 1 TsaE [Corynebacterium sp.]|nr:tRNA (adenosine(37)-N6)-threonylcarbamoyltransferase complex ATPase subunit type 1 TsaE [Corynebacterium sp.]